MKRSKKDKLGLTRSKRAKIIWEELFGIALFSIIFIIVLIPFVGKLGGFFDTATRTEKNFEVFVSDIDLLLSGSDPVMSRQGLPLSIEDNYIILGFDANYQKPDRFISTLAPGEPSISSDHEFVLFGHMDHHFTFDKPDACGSSSCICLYDSTDRERIPLSCRTFSGDVVISGYDYDNLFTSSETILSPISNHATKRQEDVLFGPLEDYGFDQEVYEMYTHLALLGRLEYSGYWNSVSWVIRTLYIEKITVFDDDQNPTIYLLIVPVEETSRVLVESGLGEPSEMTFSAYRQDLISRSMEGLKQQIISDIQRLSLEIEDQTSPDFEQSYNQLFTACRELSLKFPDTQSPSGCSAATICYRRSIDSFGCRIDTTPCICGSSVCTSSHSYCYSSGCASESSSETCGW